MLAANAWLIMKNTRQAGGDCAYCGIVMDKPFLLIIADEHQVL
jgi:hypothetical protein